jgi:putative hydrolase of the HAD superfamily
VIKVLLFDFGGTLDADGLTWPERFFLLYSKERIPGSRAEHENAFYRSEEALEGRADLRGLDLEATVLLQVQGALARLQAPAGAAERVAGAFTASARAALRRNAPMLERLSRRFKLGIVSNFYGNLAGVLEAEGLGRLFGAVADSAVVGAIKPDPAIFRHALRALGAEPSEALMVGDSIKRDMRGAEGLSMSHAFLSAADEACCPRGTRIKSLLDLEAVLENGLAHAR